MNEPATQAASLFPYTDEKHVLMLVSLLKAHGIRKVVASPGSANSSLVVSLQNDPHFEMVSCVDERSAAYMACGLAAETSEAVVITCTGATASRNYLPGMTEAYYRKLPVLAITASQDVAKVGHHIAQVIDRSRMPVDTYVSSANIPIIKDADDAWHCQIVINKAILDLKRMGGGPVHLNLPTTLGGFNKVAELPKVRVIHRITRDDPFPPLPQGRIAVFVGSHPRFTPRLKTAVDAFCIKYGAVVLCDHTSNYRGPHRFLPALLLHQSHLEKSTLRPDVLVHIGEITGDYSIFKLGAKNVWRVSDDGEIRDTFRNLTYVFEMNEYSFFEHYTRNETATRTDYLPMLLRLDSDVRKQLPPLPLSNAWMAQRLSTQLPHGCTIHFGILNSLRSWNFFEIHESVSSFSNVGGFGIDGAMSTLIGASLAHPGKLFFCVLGDLAFFYDINALGNRHLGANVRILMVNNGKGMEFLTYKHRNAVLGKDAEDFVAAAGHFGAMSRNLLPTFCEELGFEYLSASTHAEFDQHVKAFTDPAPRERPILLEVFTSGSDEHEAQRRLGEIVKAIPKKKSILDSRVIKNKYVRRLRRFVGCS